jgi:hypothetical protein
MTVRTTKGYRVPSGRPRNHFLGGNVVDARTNDWTGWYECAARTDAIAGCPERPRITGSVIDARGGQIRGRVRNAGCDIR